jgi:hypothetical protein
MTVRQLLDGGLRLPELEGELPAVQESQVGMRQRVRSQLHPIRGERPRLVLVEESARVAGHAPVLLAEEAGRYDLRRFSPTTESARSTAMTRAS